MKKKTLMLLPILSVIFLSSCGVKVNTAHTTTVEVDTETVDFKEEYQEQTSFEINLPEKETIPEEEIDGRSVDETWKEYSVYVPFNGNDKTRYYTSEPGDFISDIAFNTGWLTRRTLITYNTNFYMWDDLQAQFFFDNGYATEIKTSKTPIAAATIALSKSDVQKFDLKNHFITKIRIRTVD